MILSFEKIEPDEHLKELKSTLDSLVVAEVAQYQIKSDQSLESFDFENEESYSTFFKLFSDYANPLWRERVYADWDFARVPFRRSNERIDGLLKILRTGGAYSEQYTKDVAYRFEKQFRTEIQRDAPSILIFCIAKDTLSEDDDTVTGYVVQIKNLGRLSSFFEQLSWVI
ncbi:MAG: hypothetical protein ACFFCD_01930 [Promethearchaeota archaeon]